MARITYGRVSSWAAPATRAKRAHVVIGGSSGSGTTFGPSWSAAASTCLPGQGGYCPELSELSGRGGRLGRYRLIERVGQGRQADVWRATGGGTVGEVALKVLPPSSGDPRRRAQLRHEAERGARLTGPSLLPTYEYGEADGAVYMAMPLVVGCTLAAVIAQRREVRSGRRVVNSHRLTYTSESAYVIEVVGLLARVARAAADAHDGRVAHRDIKPGNILVGRSRADGVFLCDFGLARDLDVATPSQLRDGAGSPLYMAPERLMKRPADEIRSDVFSLGVTLFEALTLSPPIDMPNDMPSALWASYLATAEPRRPSDLRPGLPAALEATILRATAREPDRRHPSATEFAGELERFLGDIGSAGDRFCPGTGPR